ncbi:MAG TPA: hypothetical protein VN253_09835 [Kofleriaceae bacterium]|nr:hypothetical protein [Kofleriaceae bacterium]
MTSKRAGVVIAAAIGAGCGGDGGTGGTPDGGMDERQTVVELPATPNRDLDLLLVMDDSVGLLEIQGSLKVSLPLLIDRLQRVPGGLPNLHVGVVSTDMGTRASGSPTPAPPIGQIGNGGCSGIGKNGVLQKFLAATITGSFLSDVAQTDGTRLKNYTGDLAVTIGQMISGGAGGCGFEQPLAAMRAALEGQPANAGFLRPEAQLAVVFVTDEDDCSAASTSLFDANTSSLGPLGSFRCTRFGVTCAGGGATPDAMNQVGVKSQCGPSPSSAVLDDIGQFRDFLRGLKSNPRQVMVAGIIGPTEPFQVELRTPPGGGDPEPGLAHSCAFQGQQGGQVADPAVRLQAFLDEFPDRSMSSTVCKQDLSAGVKGIGDLIGRVIGSPCVAAQLADAKPDEPGLQVDCVVEDVVGTTATKLEPCDAGAQPCWKLEADAASCSGPGNLKLAVARSSPPVPETVTRMRCAVEP